MSTKDRIRQVRRQSSLTQEVFAAKLSACLPANAAITRGAVGNWESGHGIKRSNLELIAKTFGVSFEWLATGAVEAAGSRLRSVPVTGMVVQGEEIVPQWQGEARYIEVPAVDGSLEAIVISGDAMFPTFDAGDIIVYSGRIEKDFESFIGQRVVVGMPSGRRFIKRISRGSKSGECCGKGNHGTSECRV